MKFTDTFSVVVLSTTIATLCHGAIPAEGLVAYYPFNGDAKDASGNGHDGNAYNVTPTTDRFGVPNGALQFNGIEGDSSLASGVSVADTLFNIGNNFSLGLWFNSSDIAKRNQDLLLTSPHTGIGISFNHNYTPGYVSYFIGPANAFWTSQANHGPKNDYQANTWYQMTFTKQGDDYSIFINGQLDSTLHLAGGFDYNVGLCIGEPGGRGGEIFKGAIDDVFVYDHALSSSEIANLSGVTAVPEPSTYLAGFTALGMLGIFGWKRRK